MHLNDNGCHGTMNFLTRDLSLGYFLVFIGTVGLVVRMRLLERVQLGQSSVDPVDVWVLFDVDFEPPEHKYKHNQFSLLMV